MPTINEVIERVDKIKLNSYEDSSKAAWLMELDGKLHAEGFGEEGRTPPREYPEDGDELLLVDAPYDNLYDLYLYAMIDFNNREIQNYNNSMELYGTALDEYRKHFHRTRLPPSAGYRNLC